MEIIVGKLFYLLRTVEIFSQKVGTDIFAIAVRVTKQKITMRCCLRLGTGLGCFGKILGIFSLSWEIFNIMIFSTELLSINFWSRNKKSCWVSSAWDIFQKKIKNPFDKFLAKPLNTLTIFQGMWCEFTYANQLY